MIILTLLKPEEVYCDGFLDVVEGEAVVSAGSQAAGNKKVRE